MLAGRTGSGGSEGELNGKAAAFEVLQVVEFDGALGSFDGFECDIAESGSSQMDMILAMAI